MCILSIVNNNIYLDTIFIPKFPGYSPGDLFFEKKQKELEQNEKNGIMSMRSTFFYSLGESFH